MRRRPTPRQEQILSLVAAGLGDKEIAVRLGLSTNTVRSHLQRHYREHGHRNRAEAAVSWATLSAEPEPLEPAIPDAGTPAGAHRGRPFGLALAAALVLSMVAALVLGGREHLVLSAGRQPARGALSSVPPRLSLTSAGTAAAVLPHSPTATIQPALAAGAGKPALVASAPTPASLAGAAQRQPSSPAASVTLPATAQLGLVNADRTLSLLQPLAWDPCLAAVAAQAAQRVAALGYLGDTGGPELSVGCKLGAARTAENVGYWSGVDDAKLNSMFLANPVQRANVMGAYRHLGAAWAINPAGVGYLAVEFG
jgi:DNA-binding CsgD family transcriptional regulator/uncharacterized protein YkwD